MTGFDVTLLLIAVGTVAILWHPKVRGARLWQATVTPLASIIGSGFLIIAPVLGFLVGNWAFAAIAALSLFAYLIGAAIRYNIVHQEPLLQADSAPLWVRTLERFSDLALVLSYMVSVAFYLRLLAAFVFQGLHMRQPIAEQLLTTALLLFIGLTGKTRGLDRLEHLEEYAVALKLGVIAALIAGLLAYDAQHGLGLRLQAPRWGWHTWRVLAGLVLVVQGFETSKYLGEKYSATVRVRSMQLAQGISAGIYIVFVLLMTPLFAYLPAGHVDETDIIALSRHIAAALPLMLIVGAVMSQFSAGVADTVGAGELLAEASRQRLPSRTGFLVVTLVATGLVWTANIFEIITYASRAFALYYWLQALIATGLAWKRGQRTRSVGFALLSAALLFVVLLAIPVGG